MESQKISCVIVEDEKMTREKLEKYASRCEKLHVAGSFERADLAYDFIRTERVQLVITDIQMPGMDGLTLIRKLGQEFLFIAVTGYTEYAIEAFELQLTDHLMKPLPFERFARAIDHVADQLALRAMEKGKS